MSFIDLILIAIIGAFVLFGLFFGLVHTLGSLLGTVIGIFIASRLVDDVNNTFGFLLGGGAFAQVLIFIILFIMITRVVGILLWFLEKIFGFFSIIPFASTINRLLGGVFGLLEGVVIVGVILFYALQVLPEDTLRITLASSALAQYLMAAVSVFQILFPENLQSLSYAID